MTCGYLATAIPSPSGNYIKNAYCLALSLMLTQSQHSRLSIMTTKKSIIPEKYKAVFEHVIELPEPDLSSLFAWKVHNFYQLFSATPYDKTVVVDADTLFFDDVSCWWDLFSGRNVIATKRILDYRGNVITYNPLREYTYKHNLPDIHNGFFYFDKSPTSAELFNRIKYNTLHWQDQCKSLFGEEIHFSSDGALQVSVKELGTIDEFTLQNTPFPTFVHMKTCMQGWKDATDKDWRKYVSYSFDDNLALEIGGFRISYPFHYHIRNFITDSLIDLYERKLGIK